jgi:hypothetical protein
VNSILLAGSLFAAASSPISSKPSRGQKITRNSIINYLGIKSPAHPPILRLVGRWQAWVAEPINDFGNVTRALNRNKHLKPVI